MTFRELNFKRQEPSATSHARPIHAASHNFNNGWGVYVYTFLPTADRKASEGWNVRIDDYAEQDSVTRYSQSIEQRNQILKGYSNR